MLLVESAMDNALQIISHTEEILVDEAALKEMIYQAVSHTEELLAI